MDSNIQENYQIKNKSKSENLSIHKMSNIKENFKRED